MSYREQCIDCDEIGVYYKNNTVNINTDVPRNRTCTVLLETRVLENQVDPVSYCNLNVKSARC